MWHRHLEAAQQMTELPGTTVPRVRYGDEADDWGAGAGHPCHDCAAQPGQLHVFACDVERCPVCTRQLLSCEHGAAAEHALQVERLRADLQTIVQLALAADPETWLDAVGRIATIAQGAIDDL